MNNLWRFVSKYNALFLFIIFFISALLLIIRNNDFQRASTLNTSNQIVGNYYEKLHEVTKYLSLDKVNKQLVKENILLRKKLSNSQISDTIKTKSITDTINNLRYDYLEAEVINKSITSRNNYLTINKGSKHGIKKGMGVICATGVVGIVWNVSENFASIQSILHEDTRINAAVQGTPYFGPLVWDGTDPFLGTLTDIPNQIDLKIGSKVVTSGLSVTFPKGIFVGTVLQSGVKGGGSFLDIKVKLSTNFYALQYVYIVKNIMAQEQQILENMNKKGTNE